MKSTFFYISPTFVWTIIIVYLSTMPTSSLTDYSLIHMLAIDKIAHVVIYAIYSFLILYSVSRGRPSSISANQWIFAWLWSVTIGILMEIIQSRFFPERHFDFLDIIANIIGSTAGLSIFKFFKQSSIWKYL